VEANRNFINKIWNVGRFVISTLPNAPERANASAQWTLADQWIQTRHRQLVRDVNRLFDVHQYGEAGRQIYEFFWSEFADWYLEIAKLQLAEGGDRAYYTAQTLMTILDTSLRLLHPFVPFITEELWGNLKATCKNHTANFAPKSGWRDALMISEWPQSTSETGDEEEVLLSFVLVMDIVRAIRNFRTEKNVKPGTKLEALITAGEKTSILSQQAGTIAALAHLDKEKITIVSQTGKTDNQPGMVVSGVEIFLNLEEVINKEDERQRLESELKEVLGQVERLQNLLGSSFAERAPAPVVEKEKQKLAAFEDTAAKLKQQINTLS